MTRHDEDRKPAGTPPRSEPAAKIGVAYTPAAGWDDGADWSSEPARWTLEDQYPDLAHLAWMAFDATELEPLLRYRPNGHLLLDWLRDSGCYTISDVLSLTADDLLEWPGIGVTKRDALVGFLRDLERDAAALLKARLDTVTAASSALDPGVARLVSWARIVAGAGNWRDLQAALTERRLPQEIADLLDGLLRRPLPPDELGATELTDVSTWIRDLEPRDAAIVRGRFLMAPAETLDEIGKQFGVSRERVRQLESKLSSRIDDLMRTEDWAAIRWRVFDLQDKLGAYAPLSRFGDYLAGSDELAHGFLLWRAGYVVEGDRIRRNDYSPLQAASLPRVDPHLPLIDEPAAEALLLAGGVDPELTDWVMESMEGVARVDGQLVLWPRSIVEKSFAILAVRGEPLSAEEIAALTGEDVSVRSLRQRLYEDTRMCRMTRSTLGLRSWGAAEYTSVVELMRDSLEEQEAMPLSVLAKDLSERFGASASSVSAFSSAPVFVVEEGSIRMRRPDEPFEPRNKPERVAGLYRLGDDVWIWNIAADYELMRGSGRTLPAEVATFFGVTPGRSLMLANSVRGLPINWPESSHVGPNLGSLKPLADAAGAATGDYVRIRFDRSTQTVALNITPDRPDETTIAGQASWLTGLPLASCRTQAALARAAFTTPELVAEVLRHRGDVLLSELAGQLP